MKKHLWSAGAEFEQETGARRLADLVNKGEEFDRVWTNPQILAATYHIIGREFMLDSVNGRDAIPGKGSHALHADWWHGRKPNSLTMW